MIDIHCHLLPGIDDGPPTAEAALALAQALVADGVTQVVCTPHVFPGRFDNWRTSIAEEHARFAALLQEHDIPLQLLWGGEVRLTPEVLELLARRELPFTGEVGGYRTLLLEMPDGQVPLGALNFVRHLLAQRVRPIIVHPERNRGVMEKIDRLQPLVDEGCYVQLTAGSLVGQFGARAQAVAAELIDRKWVHAVASDAHNLAGRRPRMRDAHDWLVQQYDAATARELTLLGPTGLCSMNAEVNLPQPAQGVPRAGAQPGRTP
jgi:protein-tyrosine phosphatase